MFSSQYQLFFNREVADETIWLEEKLPLASSSHLGASLAEVQNLQQKHLLLESEILSHDKVVSQLVTKAEQMVRSTHFAADDIKMTIGNLSEGYTTLRDISSLRKLRLGEGQARSRNARAQLVERGQGQPEAACEEVLASGGGRGGEMQLLRAEPNGDVCPY